MISNNRIQALPNSIGELANLRILLTDVNALVRLPQAIGQCRSLRILNAASNNLLSLPDEIGHLEDLRVLNLANNYLRHLPSTIAHLSKLTALWLNDNQKKPLILLQVGQDEKSQNQVLTCFLFPQTGPIFGPVSPAAAATLMAQQQHLQQLTGGPPAALANGGQPMQQVAIGVQRLQQGHRADGPPAEERRTGPANEPAAPGQEQAGRGPAVQAPDRMEARAGAGPLSSLPAQLHGQQRHVRQPPRLKQLPSGGAGSSFGLVDDDEEDARGEMLQMSNTLDKSAFIAAPGPPKAPAHSDEAGPKSAGPPELCWAREPARDPFIGKTALS